MSLVPFRIITGMPSVDIISVGVFIVNNDHEKINILMFHISM